MQSFQERLFMCVKLALATIIQREVPWMRMKSKSRSAPQIPVARREGSRLPLPLFQVWGIWENCPFHP